MEDRHTEFRRMRGEKSVYVFDTYPAADPLFHEHGFTKGEAVLVQSFVDARTGMVLGWQTYFALDSTASTMAHSLRRTEYWFSEMRREAPGEEIFKSLPSMCVPG